MGGRNGEPVDLLLLKGNKHLTKEEIEQRRQQENQLKPKVRTFKANDKVKNCETANDVFKKLKRLYKDIDFVGANDEMIINRYCLMTAEIENLETLLSKMNEDIDNCVEPKDRIELFKTITSAEITVNRIRDMLLKIEDRLFLNPVSRIKNVPVKKKEDKPKSKWDRYKSGG